MKAVAVKKPLPPWLQKAKGEGAKEAKSGKPESKAHEKGESKRFEKAEKEGMKKPGAVASVKTPFGRTTFAKKGYADGGSVSVPIPKLSAEDRAPARKTSAPPKEDDAPKGRNIFDVVRGRGKDLMDAEDRMVKGDKPVEKRDGGLVLKKKSQPSAASRSKEGAKRYANGGMVKKKGC